jgi:septal ring-binding cell division protein DamX
LSQENLAVEPEPIQVEPEVVKFESEVVMVEPEVVMVEPEVVKVDEPVELEVSNKSQQLSRFHRDLDNSLHWIESQDKSKATIQIMMIGFKNYNGKAYYDYLDSLLSKNIDISRFKIYQTSLNGSVVFGVIYGEYKNRRDAYQHIKQLPEVLKKTSPITRTIGGIWNEINGR